VLGLNILDGCIRPLRSCALGAFGGSTIQLLESHQYNETRRQLMGVGGIYSPLQIKNKINSFVGKDQEGVRQRRIVASIVRFTGPIRLEVHKNNGSKFKTRSLKLHTTN
jgi:hypothetical protein